MRQVEAPDLGAARLKDKLELARDLMSHANPTGDLAVVVERALDDLIDKLQKRRFGQTARPARGKGGGTRIAKIGSSQTGAAPSDPKLQSDFGQSNQAALPARARCTARAFLQIHHDEAWAKGGPDTPSNLRLLCAAHNQLLAEEEFGMARRTG